MAKRRVTQLLISIRRIARSKLRRERTDHTLNTTAFVNEAYLELAKGKHVRWQSREHFLAFAARAMRNILVSHARRRKRVKRGGGAPHVSLSGGADLPAIEAERILGLDFEETTAVGISTATAKRDWTVLRGWLRRELENDA